MGERHLQVKIESVRSILTAFRPEWAGLDLRAVASDGTDHALFRLGTDLLVRAPKIDWADGQCAKELCWLPRLAPRLPLKIPEPLALIGPSQDYPLTLGVYRWAPGERADPDRLSGDKRAARALGRFVNALGDIDAVGGPAAGAHNHYRGIPLAKLDARVRRCLDELATRMDIDAAREAWGSVLKTPTHMDMPQWVHGDIHSANLLMEAGRLTTVIDFGLLGVGDPAADLMAGWVVFEADAREEFRLATGADEDAWARGRGWALYSALVALPYYWDSNPALVAGSRRTLRRVLSDAG